MATTENGTYYPSDYSSVADVPSDMKKMAESIDANKVQKIPGKTLSTNDFTNEYKQKLEDLENYDDTEVKKDISDIKEEQETQNTNIENLQKNDETQDELIEKLQQENENIKSALINVETEQAKSLHIEDASTVAGKLEVEGNAEQETREGYNLLDSSLFDLSSASSFATYNEDGTITFNGTISEDNKVNIRSLRKQTIAGTGNENLVVKIISGSLTGIIRLVAQDTDYGNIKYAQIGTSSYTNKLTENIEYNIFSITFENGTVMNNLKLGFMIVDDNDLDKEYEQYGAMPSPKFPSAIKCLGSNKNLFDKNNVNITNLNAINQENGTFEIATNQKHIYIECKALTSYSITKSILADTTLGIYETEKIPAINVNYHQLYLKAVSTGIATVKTGENAKYLDIRLNTNALTEEELQEILDTLKIEEGTMATSYSPYEQGSTEIKKISKNLLDDTIYKNVTITSQNDISSIDYQKFDNFKKNKTYIARIWFTDGTYVDDNNMILYGYNSNKTSVNTIPNTTSKMYDNADEIKYVKLKINSSGLEKYQNKIIEGIQIEESSTITDYEEHKQKNHILPIQQEMLNGDYFKLEEDGWKEVHGWTKIVLDGINNKVIPDTTDTSEKYRYRFNSSSVDLKKCSLSSTDEKAYCEQLKLLQDGDTYDCIEGFTVNNNFIYMYVDEFSNGNMTNNFNTELQDNNMIFHIPVVESAYTKLTCTEEQSAILDKLNELDMFDGTNNIITTEDIALLKLKYVVDTKTYVDNQIADMQNQLNTINELLSTTATSSILLDNLQTDLESEVM